MGPDFSGMGECKSSLFRVRKTFPAWGNVKKLCGRLEIVSILKAGFSILGSAFLQRGSYNKIVFVKQ
jgi:hypothetical protein